MNFKNLSLKKLLGDDWRYNSYFSLGYISGYDWVYDLDHFLDYRKSSLDVHGSAELDYSDALLFRREKEEEAAVIILHRILWDDKQTVRGANELLAEIGIDIRMGDKISKIVKKFGTPTFIDHREANYYLYADRYHKVENEPEGEDYYDYHDDFYIVRYHYLLSPSLLICFGIPKKDYGNNILTDIEILNDQEIASIVLQARMDAKKLDSETQKQKSVRYVEQKIENETIAKIQSQRVRFIDVRAENITIKEIETDDIKIRNCVFEHVTLEGLQVENFVEIRNCIFRHVTFRNHYNNHDSFLIINCEFIDCVFYDTIKEDGFSFRTCDNLFKNCLFEGNRAEKAENTEIEVERNTFLDCTFRNIRWIGDFWYNHIIGGKMEHIFYEGYDMIYNKFSEMQMEDVEVELENTFYGNVLNSVVFREVEITRRSQRNNCFSHCDTSGLEYYIWTEE